MLLQSLVRCTGGTLGDVGLLLLMKLALPAHTLWVVTAAARARRGSFLLVIGSENDSAQVKDEDTLPRQGQLRPNEDISSSRCPLPCFSARLISIPGISMI